MPAPSNNLLSRSAVSALLVGRGRFELPRRFRELPPPLIVVGMHRSGTSLAAALLATLGVYMGPRLTLPDGDGFDPAYARDGYGEAADFFALNEELLRRAGASWDAPQPLIDRLQDRNFRRQSLALLHRAAYGRLAHRYLSELPRRNRGPWGWKDPRSSLTLPMWLDLFPEARVLHARRDLEATANSIYRRALAWQSAPPAGPAVKTQLGRALADPLGAVRYLGRRLGLLPRPSAEGDPCLDPEYCLKLARLYTRETLQQCAGAGSYMEVWYEDLLDDPAETLRQMAMFAGCPVRSEQLERAQALIRPSRAGVQCGNREGVAARGGGRCRARPGAPPEGVRRPDHRGTYAARERVGETARG